MLYVMYVGHDISLIPNSCLRVSDVVLSSYGICQYHRSVWKLASVQLALLVILR